MKKIIALFCCVALIGCSKTKEISIEEIKEKLLEYSDIIDVCIADEDTDPNNLLGKQGGYTNIIFFSLKGIEIEEKENACEKATTGGGSIEFYNSHAEAEKRNEYLSNFDGLGAFSSGSHIVYENYVIRTSNELKASKQHEIENLVLDILK